MLIIVFGLPGVGKTYVSKVLEKHFGYHYYDGDQDLPETMKHAIKNQLPIDDTMRYEFFQNILTATQQLIKKYKNLVVSQTFIKEKYRKLFLSHFPSAKFILVTSETPIREKRLLNRPDYPLDLAYAQQMIQSFDSPKIPVTKISNDSDGKESIIQQLKQKLHLKQSE